MVNFSKKYNKCLNSCCGAGLSQEPKGAGCGAQCGQDTAAPVCGEEVEGNEEIWFSLGEKRRKRKEKK